MIRKLHNDGRPIDISSKLPDLIAALADMPGLAAVYLYGSYGTPYQTPLSDVDLALVFGPRAIPGFDRFRIRSRS
jgi:predicted nucleotidyltransferase